MTNSRPRLRRNRLSIIILTTACILLPRLSLPVAFSSTPRRHHTHILSSTRLLERNGLTSNNAPPRHEPKNKTKRRRRRRRPPGYWSDPENFENEIVQFWQSLGLDLRRNDDITTTTFPSNSLPVPNESLLNHFNRHDLRNAIYYRGGRDEILTSMTPPSSSRRRYHLIPGRWDEAVTTPEVQYLLRNESLGLSHVLSPSSRSRSGRFRGGDRRWEHCVGRKPKGYWNETTVLSELYSYLTTTSSRQNMPSIYMPRLSSIAKNGRPDLSQALVRFFGTHKRICSAAGLIPYNEWTFFERQFDLFRSLRREAIAGRTEGDLIVPRLCDSSPELRSLLVRFGGRRYVARRLGLALSLEGDGRGAMEEEDWLSWGNFSLDFALELMDYVREDMMIMRPPLTRDGGEIPAITMPRREALLKVKGEVGMKLVEHIERYGGFENVARRLGLSLDF